MMNGWPICKLLIAAVNRAIEQSQAYAAERMQDVSGGLTPCCPAGWVDYSVRCSALARDGEL